MCCDDPRIVTTTADPSAVFSNRVADMLSLHISPNATRTTSTEALCCALKSTKIWPVVHGCVLHAIRDSSYCELRLVPHSAAIPLATVVIILVRRIVPPPHGASHGTEFHVTHSPIWQSTQLSSEHGTVCDISPHGTPPAAASTSFLRKRADVPVVQLLLHFVQAAQSLRTQSCGHAIIAGTHVRTSVRPAQALVLRDGAAGATTSRTWDTAGGH